MLNDFRFAFRMLLRTPMFTAASILTLALGIGANTAIFSVVYAVLLRPLPFAEPARLVRIFEKNDKLNLPQFSTSVLNYLSWKEQTQTFDQIGAIGGQSFNLTGSGDPEQFNGSTITPSILPLLGIKPTVGRVFRDDEEKPGARPVVMISEALWRRRFGSDSSLIGRNINLNGIPYAVIGIAPDAMTVLTQSDILVPLIIDPGRENRLNHVTITVGRLKPGVTIAQAQAEMDTISRRVGMQYPEVKDWGIALLSFDHWFVSNQLRDALLVLLAAVMSVLLIACANVANLLLSRAAARRKEMAVRTALGAGNGRLIRQLLTESLLLSIIGGSAGVLAAIWAVRLMNNALPIGLLPVGDIGVDKVVLLFAAAVTLATGVLFGLAPAWQTAKADVNTLLNQAGRSGAGAARPTMRRALIAGELALATMLLIGAGLLMQSLIRLQQVRLGFRPEGLLTFEISPPPAKYPGQIKQWALYRQMLESVQSIPGVRGAAISSGMPFGAGNYTTTPTYPVGRSAMPQGTSIPVDWRIVSPDFFRTMEIPLLHGRAFSEQDGPSSPPVLIVSQTMVKKFWGDEDPLGRVVHMGRGDYTVVGVVADSRNSSLNQEPLPAMYLSAPARVWPLMDVAVRTDRNPEALLPAIRQRLRDLDSELPMANVRTMDQWISASAAQPRLNTILLEGFAAIALLIAAVGIYGVLSYSVTQRTRELGVRIALGAQRGDVLRLIVTEGMIVALAGIVVGIAGALGVSRAMASLLYGIQARDLTTFAGAAGVLLIVAMAACSVPALRATRVDPMTALRNE
jgi:putative ABC transport system permease protein